MRRSAPAGLTAILAALVAQMVLAAPLAVAGTPPACGPEPPPGQPGCELTGEPSPGPGGTLQRPLTASVGGSPTPPYPDCGPAQQYPCVVTHSSPTITSVQVSASDANGNTGGGDPLSADFAPDSPCHGQTSCSGKARYLQNLQYLLVRVNYQYGQVAPDSDPSHIQPLIGRDEYLIYLNGAPPPREPEIQSITFREPSPATGQFEPLGSNGTTDGNQIEIVARVINPGSSPEAATLTFMDPLTNQPLFAGVRSLNVPANSTVDASALINTEGYAWTSHGAPVSSVDVTATLDAGGLSESEETVALSVQPKPLVLVHGLNATFTTYSRTWAAATRPPPTPSGGPSWLATDRCPAS